MLKPLKHFSYQFHLLLKRYWHLYRLALLLLALISIGPIVKGSPPYPNFFFERSIYTWNQEVRIKYTFFILQQVFHCKSINPRSQLYLLENVLKGQYPHLALSDLLKINASIIQEFTDLLHNALSKNTRNPLPIVFYIRAYLLENHFWIHYYEYLQSTSLTIESLDLIYFLDKEISKILDQINLAKKLNLDPLCLKALLEALEGLYALRLNTHSSIFFFNMDEWGSTTPTQRVDIEENQVVFELPQETLPSRLDDGAFEEPTPSSTLSTYANLVFERGCFF